MLLFLDIWMKNDFKDYEKFYLKYIPYSNKGDSMAQALRHLPPIAGVLSSHLSHSMWVSWWTKRSLGTFFSGFLPFSPAINFIPTFLHTHLIHFIPSAPVLVRQAWSASNLAIHRLQCRIFVVIYINWFQMC